MKLVWMGVLLWVLPSIPYAQKVVVVIGSSTAAGFNVDHDSAWVNRMTSYYTQLDAVQKVYNFAIYGEDCYNAMPTSYIPPHGRPYPDPRNNVTIALSNNPDYVFVNFPSNNYDAYSVTEIMRCLRTIYSAAVSNGHTQCYIASTQPRTGFSTTNRRKLKIVRDSIVAEFGNWAIDFFTVVADSASLDIQDRYSLGDGVHLNDAGHGRLWRQVEDKNPIPIGTPPPITLSSFTAIKEQDEILFKWSSSVESEMSRYELQKEGDNGWSTVTVIAANNQPSEYSFVLRNKAAMAGLGILLLSMAGIGTRRRRSIYGLLIVSVILLVACHKQVEKKIAPEESSNYRLRMVSQNGTATYSRIVHI